MAGKCIEGVITPLVTPFHKDKSLDYDGFQNLLYTVSKNKFLDGIFILGSTGEWAWINMKERKKLVDCISKIPKNGKCIIINSSSPNLKKTIEFSEYAAKNGADAIGIILPKQLTTFKKKFLYMKEINKLGIPIMIYQINNSKSSLSLSDMEKLIELENVKGIKDSSSSKNMKRHVEYLRLFRKHLSILQGIENLYLSSIIVGSAGVVGGGCNVYPQLFKKIKDSFKSGNIEEAMKIQNSINDFIELIYEGNSGEMAMKYYLTLEGVKMDIYCRKDKQFLPEDKRIRIQNLHSSLNSLS